MAIKELYVDSWGTQILFDTEAESLADVSSITIEITRPDATVIERTGYVYSSTSVKVYYRLQEGDLDQLGIYRFGGWLDWVSPSKHLPMVPFLRRVIAYPAGAPAQ